MENPTFKTPISMKIKGLNMEFLNKRDYLIKVLKAQGLDYNMLRAYRFHYMCKLIWIFIIIYIKKNA
jgi:hypothetical protein